MMTGTIKKENVLESGQKYHKATGFLLIWLEPIHFLVFFSRTSFENVENFHPTISRYRPLRVASLSQLTPRIRI